MNALKNALYGTRGGGRRMLSLKLIMPLTANSSSLSTCAFRNGQQQLTRASWSICRSHQNKTDCGERKWKCFGTFPNEPSSQMSTSPSSAEGKNMWDLYAGIVVERKPVLTQNYDEFQKKYLKVMAQQEFEISKKSDHEIRHASDVKMLEQVKSGEIELGSNVRTARDDEDKWNAEAQSFEPAKRETDADLKKDLRSLDRALDSHLLLVVEQKLGNEYRWVCPHSKLNQGENLRQAAERMMKETFPNMKTKILGHAPWGFYKYKYPKSESTDASVGGKVFFYKAQVESGDAAVTTKNKNVKDFLWLKRDELPTKLVPEYYKKLSECLIDD